MPFVYGPGDYSRIYPYLKRMDDNRPILLDENKDDWRICRGYIEDIANAIVLSALDTRSGNRIYNVGEEDAYSELEWIEQISQVAEWRNKLIKVSPDKLPLHLKEPLAWEQNLTLDTHRIRGELNYKELYSHEDSMRKSINWLRSYKPTQTDNNLFDYNAEDNALSLLN